MTERGELLLIYSRFDDWLPELPALRQFLSKDELSRAGRFRSPADASRFEAGRGWLRLILGFFLEKHPSAVRFAYSQNGKPTVEGGLGFNLSHTRDDLLLAISIDGEVGVDLEACDGDADYVELAKQILSPDELAAFRGIPVEDRREAFFRAWTVKEAWLKATGQGFSVPPEEVEVFLGADKDATWFPGANQGQHLGNRVASFNLGHGLLGGAVCEHSVTKVTSVFLIPAAEFISLGWLSFSPLA